MAVYVDDMRARFGRMIMCHMVGDTDDELHQMADTINLPRRWFQGDHYDISLSKRALAVAAGAVEINQQELVQWVIARRRAERAAGTEV